MRQSAHLVEEALSALRIGQGPAPVIVECSQDGVLWAAGEARKGGECMIRFGGEHGSSRAIYPDLKVFQFHT